MPKLAHPAGLADLPQVGEPSGGPECALSAEAAIDLTTHDAQHCYIHNWYNTFRKHTIKTRYIALNNDVLEYLAADTVQLSDSILPIQHNNEDTDSDTDSSHSDTDLNSDTDHGYSSAALRTLLDPLIGSISTCLSELQHRVCPQLNDVIPSDAVWVSTEKSLRCQSAGDILLLLKSSDRVAAEASSTGQPSHLVLRQYCELHPARLLRCFVKEKQMIGISQIDTEYHEYLNDQHTQRQLTQLLQQFYTNVIRPEYPCDAYVFDAYIDQNHRVWLIKFKPWSTATSAHLFDWQELLGYDVAAHRDIDAEFRVVQRNGSQYYDVSMRNTAQKMLQRMPHIDNIDVSDSAAIERFVAAVQTGTL